MRSLQASRWQTFAKLEVPAALPVVFGGLKVAVTLAVIGAVVGEFVGADRGLGFLINLARGILDTPMLFVALFCWSRLPWRSTSSSSLEHVVLRWRARQLIEHRQSIHGDTCLGVHHAQCLLATWSCCSAVCRARACSPRPRLRRMTVAATAAAPAGSPPK